MIDPVWAKARNILCIRLDSLGDVLMTTPAIRALKESIPGSSITLLTSPAGSKPAAFIPEVNEVISYESPWMKASPARANSRYDHAMIETLKRRRFDAAVIFTVFSQNPLPAAFLCYLAEIPLTLAHCRENPYHLLSNWVKETEPDMHIRHEVQRQLDLVATIGCEVEDRRLRFDVPASSLACARQKLTEAGLDFQRPWLVLHPGVTATSRQYPPEQFVTAVQELMLADHMQVVLTGVEQEKELVTEIENSLRGPIHNMAGKLSLDELAGVLKLAPLLIANNTGPVHLAAAVGTPVVDLYALTNPQHTPWGTANRVLSHDVPCKFCYKSICPQGHHNCLRLVSPQEVVKAARELLAGG